MTRPVPNRLPSQLPIVLVADADSDTRSLYRELLREIACEVIEAADGRDALAQALVRRPTAVVSEFRLPFIDGMALCEILRRDHATAKVPIVIVTGETNTNRIDGVRRAGADVVLTKPITPDILVREIKRLTDGSPPEHQRGHAASTESQHAGRRVVKAKAHARFVTTTPPALPPSLMCPSCDGRLSYEWSHVGGVSAQQSEQWDYLSCTRCGAFRYRHRTHRLQRLTEAERRWVMRSNG